MEVASAALRWEGARTRRLVIDRQLRESKAGASNEPFHWMTQQHAEQQRLEAQHREARRHEIAALRMLGKITAKHRATLEQSCGDVLDVLMIEQTSPSPCPSSP
jgi:hypothetical protein